MIEVRKIEPFNKWIKDLRDQRAKVKILTRISRLEDGNFGDHRILEGKIGELKIDYGPGYRIYFARNGNTVVILLCGGDKSTQKQDIKSAKELAKDLE